MTSRPEVDWSKTELWLGDLPGDVETWELEAFLAGFAGYEGVQIRKNKTGVCSASVLRIHSESTNV